MSQAMLNKVNEIKVEYIKVVDGKLTINSPKFGNPRIELKPNLMELRVLKANALKEIINYSRTVAYDQPRPLNPPSFVQLMKTYDCIEQLIEEKMEKNRLRNITR